MKKGSSKTIKKTTDQKAKTLISKKGYGIFLDSISKDELESLKKTLTVKPNVMADYDFGIEPFPVYRLSDTRIYIPKYYGLKHYGDTKNQVKEGDDAILEFSGSLKPHQVDFCDTVLKELRLNNSCIACSGTGSGKTTMSLWLASQLKKRTLIIVHKQFLMDQWIERIKQFIPKASIGIIKQEQCDIKKDIVIGMIQSITMREYPEHTFDGFGLTIWDECFVHDQLIITDNGPVKIGTLYKKWKNNETLPKVLSYNQNENKFEFKSITYAWEKSTEKILNIKYGRSYIKCTPNHKILTQNGFVEANQLKIGDLIKSKYTFGEQVPVAQDLNDDQYQILLGSFLGDGNIQKLDSNRYRLRIIHSEKQKEYCEWKALMFGKQTEKIENNGYAKGVAYRFTTKIIDLTEELPQTKTSCPQWILDQLDIRGLAIWWMDDGYLSRKNASGELSTCSFDEDSQIRIVKKLSEMGIEAKYRKNGHGYHTVFLNKKGIDELIKITYKYSHESMHYKFYNEKIKLSDEVKYIWNTKFLDSGTVKISSIKEINKINKQTKVYDLEIEDNHNFVLSSGIENICGPIVHNCHHIAGKTFSNSLFKSGSKITLGLSATPKRMDGLTKILEWFLGPIIKNELLSEIEKPTVKFIESEYSSNIVPKFNFKGNLNAPNMVNQLVADDARNNQIIEEIIALNKEGRKILVLSGRRGHCEVLNERIRERLKKVTTGLYLGGMKNGDLETSNKASIIFATYSMASEAYDNPDLDTLIMATGMGSIQQAVGRIIRKKNKFHPLVVDFTDIEYFGGQARRRKQFYKKSGYIFHQDPKKVVEPGSESESESDSDVCLFDD